MEGDAVRVMQLKITAVPLSRGSSLPGVFAVRGSSNADRSANLIGAVSRGSRRGGIRSTFRLEMPARDHLHEHVRKALESDGTTFDDVFAEGMGQLLLANGRLKLLIFSTETEVIERWTPEPPTVK
jgi:hypothetical protein